jgi:hypothetical protein
MTHKVKILKKTESGVIDFEIEGLMDTSKGEVFRLIVNPGQDANQCLKEAADAIIKNRTQKVDISKIPDEINL